MAIGAMHASLSSLPSRNVLIWLNQQIGETCNLAVPDNDAMVYVDRVETQWPLRIALHIGSRVPLHATAAGKVTLSLLSEEAFERYLLTGDKQSFTNKTIVDTTMLREEIELVRVRGFATDQEELVDGMIAVAVPVMDARRNFCATLSFHAPTQRLSLEQGLTHLENLRQAAEKLGKFI
jgi:DNA-binding IclR family transcriptional regulator